MEENNAMTEVAETSTGTTRPGRPRPQDTIERDEHVYQTLLRLASPSTRNQIADAANVKSSFVYLSLIRLRRAGHVQRVTTSGEVSDSKAGNAWTAVAR